MKFYISIQFVSGFRRRFFSFGENYLTYILSVSVMCENGIVHTAYNKHFPASMLTREQIDNTMPSVPVRSSHLFKNVHEIAEGIKLFILHAAGSKEIEFYSYDSAVCSSLFFGMFGGAESTKYPEMFPKTIIDLKQNAIEYLHGIDDSHFTSVDGYGIILNSKKLSIREKNEYLESHELYPAITSGQKYTSDAFVKWICKYDDFLRLYKEWVEKTKEASL